MPKGFTHTQEITTKFNASTETKSASTFSVEPKPRMVESKSAAEIVKKVSQDFSPAVEVKSEFRREVAKTRSKVVRPVRTASHALSADNEFWSPRR